MKNIALVIRHDLRRASHNVIAIVVLFGVAVIPSFFAWFNVLSSWDPFGNVKNLKVAVADADEGYKSDLFPLKVTIGQQVLSSLRANSDLDWVFTTSDEAINGTKSEKYYAALVLPPDFSEKMMTFLSADATPAQIEYYINEKTNALSPKIAGQAAAEVSTQINEAFTKTMNEVGLSLVSSLAHQLGTPQTEAALARMQSNVSQLAAQLRSASDTATMFNAVIASGKPLVTSAASLTNSSSEAIHQGAGVIGDGVDAARRLKSVLGSATSSLSAALASSASGYDALSKRVSEVFTSLGDQREAASETLHTLLGQVDTQIEHYETLRDELLKQADAAGDPALHDALTLVAADLDAVIDRQEALRDRIDKAATTLTENGTISDKDRAAITQLAGTAKAAIQSARSTYLDSLKPKLDRLAATITSINSNFLAVGNGVTAATAALTGTSGSLLGALTSAQDLTATLAKSLNTLASDFDDIADAFQKATESGDLSEIATLIGPNPTVLAGELTSPVGLKRIPVFAVATFGAQMAPFYTVLGMWIGALLLSVLIRVNVERKSLPLSRPLTLTQEYAGRFGIFALLAFIQSTLLFVGLIALVGVRPVYPFLLILAGWVMSFVFTSITYTLVVSFGEAGKALAVILLVVQISSGGGAYPLAVLPQWFQNLSPFVPVTHATDAVRSAIAGIYQNDYWVSLGWLALFLVPTLLLGLALRLPLVKLNKSLDTAIESTKLM